MHCCPTSLKVVVPPIAAVVAADAIAAKVFTSDEEDAYITLLLAVAQAEIDGWDGWLGRAIGLQTLEATVAVGCVVDTSALPLPPYVDTVSDTINPDGKTRAFRWRAGYGASPAKPLPAPIKHAIIMMAGMLRDAVPADEGSLKSKTVDGVGRWDYSLPDGAADAMKSAAERLLSTYRVYA